MTDLSTNHGAKQPARRLKVLQLQPDYHENSHDYSDLAEQIVLAFPRERYEVTTAFLQGTPAPGAEQTRAEHAVYFELPEKALRGLRIGLRLLLLDFLRKNRFDIVICNRYKPVSLLMQLNKLLRIPVCIGISHGFGEYDSWQRKLFSKLHVDSHWRFVGVSSAVRDYLIKQKCGFTINNTIAITNAFDLDMARAKQLPKADARQQLGLPAHGRIIGAAGRLVRVKGHLYLIEAFAQIAKQYPDTFLAIIGEGKERKSLLATISTLGLEGRVFLTGFVPGAKRFVRAFDIWTMPSLSEGLGLALLEGMSGALPIIASDIPAMKPLINGAGGITTPPGNSKALADALDRYLSLDAMALLEKGEETYRYVAQNHSIEDYRKKYLGLVESTMAEQL